MAFTPTDSVPVAKVTIKFSGLMLLRSNGTLCEVGIHRLSDLHLFQVILTIHKPNLPPTLVRLTTGNLQGQFTIVSDRAGAAFKAFQTDAGAFDPANQNNHELDHRWALNMRALHANADFTDAATPIASLNDGVLYTSNLTRRELNSKLVRPSETKPIARLGADLAAAVDLSPGRRLTLNWTDTYGSPTPPFYLPRQHDPIGTTYTVTLLNEPKGITSPDHDELALYYDVLKANGAPIEQGQRWKLIYESSHKSDEIPCLPVILNT